MMAKSKIIVVKGISITTIKIEKEVYISLTDIARNKNTEEPKDVVKNWMRSKTTIEFLGIWEELNNPAFKGVEFDSFKTQTTFIYGEFPRLCWSSLQQRNFSIKI